MRKILGNILGIGSLVLIVIVVCLGFANTWMLMKVRKVSTDVERNWLPSVVILGRINSDVLGFRILELHHNLSSDPKILKLYEEQMKLQLNKINLEQQVYRPLITSNEERAFYEPFAKKWAEYLKIHENQFLLLSGGNRDAEAHQVLTDSEPTFVELSSDLQNTIEFNWNQGISATRMEDRTYVQLIVLTQILLALVATLSVAIVASRF